MKFAVITPALIAGAFLRADAFPRLSGLHRAVVVAGLLHRSRNAEWGGGFLGAGGLHAIDFAGGSVVHELAGAAALATALYLRRHHSAPSDPHSVPLVLLGAGILWFGWFGFNAGSALSAGAGRGVRPGQHPARSVYGDARVDGHRVAGGRASRPGSGSPTGAVAGLAAITPASGYVLPMAVDRRSARAAGVFCYGAVHLKDIFHYDDSLDVVGVHMVAGALGVVLTGVFASLAVNAAGEPAGWTQLGRQAVLAIAAHPPPVRHDLDHPVGHRPHRRIAGQP